ncbi:hypothetical protein [Microbacterium sp.]|uniref:hypothetical protein n=1 Tax=Microbacterium sp. TaxID=51671 RepID=UPI0039E5A14B
MTFQLSVDPGLNTGISLGFYDATTPYRLLGRWQVHNGLTGFIAWMDANAGTLTGVDEAVVERFVYEKGANADISGVPIEGVVALWAHQSGATVLWHTRFDKAGLTGYPPEATTKAQRQRVRFDLLERFDMFAPGTENDDSNDAICHSLVNLKNRRHAPTLRMLAGGKDSA